MKMILINFFTGLIAGFILFPHIVYAQVAIEDSLKVELEEIMVEAAYSSITIDRAPMSLSYYVRSSGDVTSRPAATMDELTFSLPGIFISNRENYALGERLTIRGLGWRSQFGVRGAQVILDDIPLTVADGQTIMNMVDPATVERIELLRGPSATFWGNSSGGVLFMSTKPAVDAPTLQYRGYGGSYNTIKQEIRLNSRIGDTRLYGYATYFDTEGFREHSAARLFRGSVGGERAVSENGYLDFRFTYAGMPKAQHPGSLNKENARELPRNANPFFANNGAGKTFEQAMAAVSYMHNFESGTLSLAANGTWRDLQNPLPFGYVGLERNAGGLRSMYRFDDFTFDLYLGGELKIQQDDRLETDIVNGERGDEIRVQQLETVTNQALFTRLGIPFNQRFSFNFGLRADWLQFSSEDELGNSQEGDRSFFALNPSAGFIYRLENARIFTNFSTSFESPTTVELVNRPEGGNGFNQNLNPERTVSLETGIQGNLQNFSYDFTVYGMKVNDLIVSFQLEQGGPNFFQNEGNSIHYGFESAVGYSITDQLNLRLMLNLLQAEFEDGEHEGNSIPGVAPFRFATNLTYSPRNHHFSIDNEWVGKYQTNSANTETNDAYSIFNFRWSLEVNNLFENISFRPFVSVQNVLNTRYNTSVAINNAGGLFFEPGTDRNFRLGLQVNLF
jgi:iron complex outermembrane recepter protein